MKTNHYTILGLLLTVSIAVKAQTVNVGEITILPNTQMGIVNSFDNKTTGSLMNDGELFVYADFNNDGLFLYFDLDNNGLTRFEGQSVQNITGSELSEFNYLLFNNSTLGQNDILLNNRISIANEANFINGIVNNESGLGEINFENNAIAINASNNSFVDGWVYKNGDEDFNFPIGDGLYYRVAAISAPANIADEFTSKYYFEDPDTNYPRANKSDFIEVIDNSEYWVVENTSGNEEVFITLSWDNLTTPTSITGSPNESIHIVRWNEVAQLWEDEGGVVDANTNTVTTLATIPVYGVFTLARVNLDNVLINLEDNSFIYNVVTPNNDGIHDYFLIEGIENLANNQVEIFNRWGVKVFSTRNYDTVGNVFTGVRQNTLLNENGFLPTGTYFYILSYEHVELDGTTRRVEMSGYLYLTI